MIAKQRNSLLALISFILLIALSPLATSIIYGDAYQNIPACAGGEEPCLDIYFDLSGYVQNIYYTSVDLSRSGCSNWAHSIVVGNRGFLWIVFYLTSDFPRSTANVKLTDWRDPNNEQHGLTSFSGDDQGYQNNIAVYFTATNDAVPGTYKLSFMLYSGLIAYVRFNIYIEIVSSADTDHPAPYVMFTGAPSSIAKDQTFDLWVGLSLHGPSSARNTQFARDCGDGLQIYLENAVFSAAPSQMYGFESWYALDYNNWHPRDDIVGSHIIELCAYTSTTGGNAYVHIKATGEGPVRIKYKGWMLDDDLVYNTLTSRVENVIFWAYQGSPSFPYNGEWAQNSQFDDIAATSEPAISIPIPPTEKPDLIVTDISWSPSNPVEGNTMNFVATIKNQGSANAGSFTVVYVISDSSGNTVSVDRKSFTGLNAYSTTQYAFSWVAKSGSYKVLVVADALGNVDESNEDNNNLEKTFNVGTAPPNQYYLTVNTEPSGLTSISGSGWYDAGTTAHTGTAPSSVTSGSTTYKFSTWKVDGNSVTGNPISVYMDDAHTVTAVYTITGVQPPSLTLYEPQINGLSVTINGVTAPGSSGTSITRIHWNWGDGTEEDQWFPASHTYGQSGTYTVTVTVYQSDGLSTTKSVTVTVSVSVLADLAFQKVGFDKSEPFTEGDLILFGAVIVNQGDANANNFRIEVWLDGSLYDSGTISLNAKQSTTLWCDNYWTTTRGTHTIRWVADVGNVIPESNENNNEMSRTFTVATKIPPLQISAQASPTSGTAPLVVSFTVSVSGGITPYSYYWNFGDGSTSNDQSPTHTYNSIGSFGWSLTVRDNSGLSSTASGTITVSKASSSISIYLSSSKIAIGDSITISGTISPAHAATVYLRSSLWGGGDVGIQSSSSGTFSYTWYVTDISDVGSWNVQASWSGDADHEGATSSPVSFEVTLIPTTLSIASPSSAYVGDTVQISGSISPAFSGAKITVYVTGPETKTSYTATDQNGHYAIQYTTSKVGTYSLRAVFGGDSTHSGSSSKTISFAINKIPTSLSLQAYPTSTSIDVLFRQPVQVTISGTISPGFSTTIHLDSNIVIQTSVDGSFTTMIPFEIGHYVIVASFSENDKYLSSTAQVQIDISASYTSVVVLFFTFFTLFAAALGIWFYKYKKPKLPPPPPPTVPLQGDIEEREPLHHLQQKR